MKKSDEEKNRAEFDNVSPISDVNELWRISSTSETHKALPASEFKHGDMGGFL